jgi:glycosyltransferase involved in cell wall biosynthesis
LKCSLIKGSFVSPDVAVIIPTFNRAAVLARAIRSVLDQSFRNFELVVVDDGSTDNTADLQVLRGNDPRLRFLRLPENRGVAAARNAGVRETTAPRIAFLDSDDEWFPAKLARQFEWMVQNAGSCICQTRELWIRRGVRVNPPKTHDKTGGDLFAASIERCMITPSSVMLSRELFERAGGFNESFPACEDYDLWLRVTSRHPVGLVDDYLLKRYGGHADQLSSTVPVLDRFRIRSLLALIEGGTLAGAQRSAAVLGLVKRATILAHGYQKRGNTEEYEQYQGIIDRFGRAGHPA